MAGTHVSLHLPGFGISVTCAFRSRSEAELVRGCVMGRPSGARLPDVEWRERTSHGRESAEIRLLVRERGDDLLVRFGGAVRVPAYSVDKAGFHWDFFTVFSAVAFPRLLAAGVVPLHAAVLRAGRETVLLPGVSGAGKSSVAFAGLERGAVVAAGELAFVRDASLVAGNSTLTIDPVALRRFGLSTPAAARESSGRLAVATTPVGRQGAAFTSLVFPRVADTPLVRRVITPRRARMLLFENALGQLPVAHLVAHETHPLGLLPAPGQLALLARTCARLSFLQPRILEGRPRDIVDALWARGPGEPERLRQAVRP